MSVRRAQELETLQGDGTFSHSMGKNVARLLVCTLALQLFMTLAVAVSFLVGCWLISNEIREFDLTALQAIIVAVRNSAINVEEASVRVLDSISFASRVIRLAAMRCHVSLSHTTCLATPTTPPTGAQQFGVEPGEPKRTFETPHDQRLNPDELAVSSKHRRCHERCHFRLNRTRPCSCGKEPQTTGRARGEERGTSKSL